MRIRRDIRRRTRGVTGLRLVASFILGINVLLVPPSSQQPRRTSLNDRAVILTYSSPFPLPKLLDFCSFFPGFWRPYVFRPNSCNQKPPHHLSFVNAFMPSSGHASISISTSRPSSMRRDILPWIQRTMTHDICMLPRCFVQGKHTQLCISSMFHLKYGVVGV